MECNVHFRSENCLFGTAFSFSGGVFAVDFGRVTGVISDPYTGEYDLYPGTDEQTLATKEKVMSDDVTLHAIPQYIVDNPAGGRTITIGG